MSAPVHARVVALALLALALLAGLVGALHRVNALHPVAVMDAATLGQTQPAPLARVEQTYSLHGALHVVGALPRPGETVGEVNLRCALVAAEGGEVIVLRTEMVRRPEVAKALACDDHCGFHATVDASLPAGRTWRVLLLDGVSGRALDAGVTLAVSPDGAYVNAEGLYREGESTDGPTP